MTEPVDWPRLAALGEKAETIRRLASIGAISVPEQQRLAEALRAEADRPPLVFNAIIRTAVKAFSKGDSCAETDAFWTAIKTWAGDFPDENSECYDALCDWVVGGPKPGAIFTGYRDGKDPLIVVAAAEPATPLDDE